MKNTFLGSIIFLILILVLGLYLAPFISKLEGFIRDLYTNSIKQIFIKKKIDIKMINIINPCPLFEVLDSSKKEQYLVSVEPSIEGGKLMAIRFVDQIKIHKYIRNFFCYLETDKESMEQFRDNWVRLKILINELLKESIKLNNSKKDKYYYSELKRYINIILKNKNNTNNIYLFTRYLANEDDLLILFDPI